MKFILFLTLPILSYGQWNEVNRQVFDPPADQSMESYEAWNADRLAWIKEQQPMVDLSIYYDYPQMNWTQTSFIQPQTMIHEKTLYDKATNTFTVDKYVNDINDRYDGIESILLWPTYPNIGADDRNQYDMTYSFDKQQLKDLVDDFHRHDIKVLWPYNPWDQFTRNTGKSDMESLADLIIDTGADGFNGDTMDGVNASFFEEAADRGYPILIEPEYMHENWEYLDSNLMAWNYWQGQYTDVDAPSVSAYKMLTNSLAMNHICERWATDRTDGLQNAFFNGIGYISWENVWGIFNKITDRDGAVMKRTSKILRFFGKYVQGTAADFLPHYPAVENKDSLVYTSLFADKEGGWNMFLMVNRNRKEEDLASGTTVDLNLPCPGDGGSAVWLLDVYNGDILDSSASCGSEKNMQIKNFVMEGGGYGAFLISTVDPNGDTSLMNFLSTMKELTSTPLNSFSNVWKVTKQTILDNTEVSLPEYMSSGGTSDAETVTCLGSTTFNFTLAGLAIEGDDMADSIGVDVQYPFEDYPYRYHQSIVSVPDLVVDKHPVTYEIYKEFLTETGYRPEVDDINFLRDWDEEGNYPQGSDNKPVSWVSHNDARVFCKYYGKRLPGAIEWQYIARGVELNTFPWGNENGTSGVEFPEFNTGRIMPAADDVDAHPSGASWCGVEDLVGNVFQWTDVFMDEHTDRAVLGGSSRYRPDGSFWYLPQPGNLAEMQTYLMSSEGLDRSAGVGFRCVSGSGGE